MASLTDYEMDRIQNAWTENDVSIANTALTVTHAAAVGRHHTVLQVDASFSDILGAGLLTIKFGTVTKARKVIFGAGAMELSLENPTANQDVSATLAAGGGAYLGYITMTGFTR